MRWRIALSWQPGGLEIGGGKHSWSNPYFAADFANRLLDHTAVRQASTIGAGGAAWPVKKSNNTSRQNHSLRSDLNIPIKG